MSWALFLTPFVLSAALTAATGGYAWSLRHGVPSARAFATVQLLECAWTLGAIGELLAPTLRAKLVLDHAQYGPMTLGAVACLAFALRYTGRAAPRRARWIWAALAAAIAPFVAWSILGAAARPLDPSVRVEPVGPFGALLYDFGATDGVLIAYALLLVAAAVVILLDALPRQHPVHRWQTAVLTFGLALPAIASVVVIATGLRIFGQRDGTPWLFGASAALTAWALFSRRVLDLVPVARDLIVERLPDAVIVLDGRGRVAEANAAASRFLKPAREDAIGRDAADVLRDWDAIARAISGSTGSEGARITVAGSTWDVRSAIVGPADRPAGRAVVLRDISALHRANIALRDAREDLERRVLERTRDLAETNDWLQREVVQRADAESAQRDTARQLQALFDNAFQLIGLLSPEGEVLAANRTALEFGGVDAAEVVGSPFWATPWWRDDAAQAQRIRAAIAEAAAGGFVRFDVRTRRARDGALRELDFSLKPVRDANGHVTVLVAEGRDLTELRQGERDRRALGERLERAQRVAAIGRFAGGIGHDFNNLLTIILANAKIARSEAPDRTELADMLDDLIEAAEDAGDLTKQLLSLSGRQPIHPEPVALAGALDRARRLLAPILGDRVALRTDVAPGVRAWVDPRQLEQILASLAGRARDVLRDGGTLTVEGHEVALDEAEARAKGVAPGRWVVLAVRDDGEAVGEEAQRHLFEPFHAPASGAHGGLGLATVHGAVTRSGGWIEVRSGAGRGTTFEIGLPSAEGRAAAEAAPREPIPAGRGERVVVVEDQEPVRLATTRILTKLGYHVRAFASGAEALEGIAHGEPVDLLVTDVSMPDMSGPALVDVVRARRPGLRVLYVSGLVEDGDPDVERAREDAFFLSKPFTPAALAHAVRTALPPGAGGAESAPAQPTA